MIMFWPRHGPKRPGARRPITRLKVLGWLVKIFFGRVERVKAELAALTTRPVTLSWDYVGAQMGACRMWRWTCGCHGWRGVTWPLDPVAARAEHEERLTQQMTRTASRRT